MHEMRVRGVLGGVLGGNTGDKATLPQRVPETAANDIAGIGHEVSKLLPVLPALLEWHHLVLARGRGTRSSVPSRPSTHQFSRRHVPGTATTFAALLRRSFVRGEIGQIQIQLLHRCRFWARGGRRHGCSSFTTFFPIQKIPTLPPTPAIVYSCHHEVLHKQQTSPPPQFPIGSPAGLIHLRRAHFLLTIPLPFPSLPPFSGDRSWAACVLCGHGHAVVVTPACPLQSFLFPLIKATALVTLHQRLKLPKGSDRPLGAPDN